MPDKEHPNITKIVFIIDQHTAAVQRHEVLDEAMKWVSARPESKENRGWLPVYTNSEQSVPTEDHVHIPVFAIQHGLQLMLDEYAAEIERLNAVLQLMADALEPDTGKG